MIAMIPLIHKPTIFTARYKQYITGKDQPLNVHGRHQSVCKKWKKIGNSNKRCENIQSGYRDGILLRKKCAILIMNSSEQHITDGMELPNPEKMKMLEEKETYKNLGILETDTIKQVEIKERI